MITQGSLLFAHKTIKIERSSVTVGGAHSAPRRLAVVLRSPWPTAATTRE